MNHHDDSDICPDCAGSDFFYNVNGEEEVCTNPLYHKSSVPLSGRSEIKFDYYQVMAFKAVSERLNAAAQCVENGLIDKQELSETALHLAELVHQLECKIAGISVTKMLMSGPKYKARMDRLAVKHADELSNPRNWDER